VSGEMCSECDGYEVVIVDGEEVHCATCSLRAEVAQLRAWKSEATIVLMEWDRIAETIIAELDFNDTIGRRKSDIVGDEIERLRAEVGVPGRPVVSGDGYRMGEMERIALAAANSDLRSDLLAAQQEIERLRAEVERLHQRITQYGTVLPSQCLPEQYRQRYGSATGRSWEARRER